MWGYVRRAVTGGAKQAIHLRRDTVLFIAGLAGVVYETAFENVERPSLLMLFAGMMGLPAFLRRDESNDDDSTGTHGGPGDRDPR